MTNKVKQAREFAAKYHKHQKYGEHDYMFHLDGVYDLAVYFGFDEDVQVAAYLHDVLEDTECFKEDIEDNFGKSVSDLVWAVTGEGMTRKEKMIRVDERIKFIGEKAFQLKMIDRLFNIRQSNKDKYLKKIALYVKEEWFVTNLYERINSLNDRVDDLYFEIRWEIAYGKQILFESFEK